MLKFRPENLAHCSLGLLLLLQSVNQALGLKPHKRSIDAVCLGEDVEQSSHWRLRCRVTNYPDKSQNVWSVFAVR